MLALILAVVCAGPAYAQQGYTYDVVVIRLNTTGSSSTHVSAHPGTYTATNISMKTLLVDAFGLQTAEQLAGLPGWAGSARYDVTAKVDEETAARLKKMDHAEFKASQLQASQALLADRFGLVVHHETRELPEYALVQTKAGSTLKPGDEMGPKAGGVHTSNHTLAADAVRLDELTAFLAQQVHRPVVDRTGLAGKFDLALTWSPDDAADTAMDKAPGLMTAIQEQMGLRLEAIKGPVDTVVIDQLKAPTEN